jgi:glycosyltransferase involved in cell wall biosynthesis
VVAEGAGGVRLASRDPDVWAAEALALLADRRRWDDLSRRGRAFVRRRFSAARTAERLLAEIYTR